VKELRGFERITLGPGETTTVTFEVGPEDLSFYDRDLEETVEPGRFDLMVGPHSGDVQAVPLDVVAR
jgi:beta-glucosidase